MKLTTENLVHYPQHAGRQDSCGADTHQLQFLEKKLLKLRSEWALKPASLTLSEGKGLKYRRSILAIFDGAVAKIDASKGTFEGYGRMFAVTLQSS